MASPRESSPSSKRNATVSLRDETAVYSQRGVFRLLTDHMVQKGPSFPKPVDMTLVAIAEADYVQVPIEPVEEVLSDDPEKIAEAIEKLETEMREAAKRFEFERAAELRDRAKALRTRLTAL